MNKLNSLAEKGFKELEGYYKEIFKDYKKYGEVVLTRTLTQDEEKIKEIILKSKDHNDFNKNMEELWRKDYQTIINSCADIKKAFNETPYGEEIYVDTNFQRDAKFIVSREFFKKLKGMPKFGTYKNVSYIKVDNDIYQIQFGKVGALIDFISITQKISPNAILED